MATKPIAQLGIDETQVDDAELEADLEAREDLRADLSNLRREYETTHKRAVGKIEDRFIDLDPDAVLRVGRFRISRTETNPRSVAFESGASIRLVITPDGSDE